MKIVDETGAEQPHDGQASGRLLVRGMAIAASYFRGEGSSILDDDGFFDTGDVASIDPFGAMRITDRAKDVIKSGGEWISSIDIENIALSHPGVANAAAVGVPHPKWDERPVLVIEAKQGNAPSADDLRAFLAGKIARWWMPDDYIFVESIPLGATGKVNKMKLREDIAARQ